MDLLRDMALFVEVAKAKNFSVAAEILGIPTSSLSRRISILEQNIGLRLLNRTTRRTELTEVGKIYFERCRHIVDEAQLAHEQLSYMVEKPSGQLKVSMSVDFGVFYMPTLIAEFMQVYPDIKLDLDLTSRNRDILAESVDVVIRMGELPSSSLYARHITEKKIQLYASKDYLDTSPAIYKPDDLDSHQCIAMPSEYSKKIWKLSNGATNQEVVISNEISVNNMGLMLKLTTLGLGISALGQEFAEADVKAGKLKIVLPEWSFKPIPIYAVTTSRLQPARIKVFIDFLVEKFSKNSSDFIE